MRCAIVSDIHANLDALNAVLERMGQVDAVYCPGDVVGYGAEPNECCDIVRERAAATVLGNHDAAAVGALDASWFNPYARAAIEWTAQVLNFRNQLFLRALPRVTRQESFVLFHGTLHAPEAFEYITSPWEAQAWAFADMAEHRLGFFGHTHVAEYYVQKEGEREVDQISMVDGGVVELKSGFRYIVNVGSVGQPRDGNPNASFAIYDSDAASVEIIRVPYDIASAQRKITQAGLPKILADRLELGM